MRAFLVLLQKEFALELRRRSVLSGLLLYLFSTVFLSYLAFRLHENILHPLVWSALFWIVLLFSAVNAIAKSFIGERKERDIYYYSVASPTAIITSKIVYNFLLCIFMAGSGFLLFALFIGNPVVDTTLFTVILALTSLGFASSLTLLSSIASKTSSGQITMAVLSFPIILSVLLIAIKVTKNCIDGLDRSISWDQLIILGAINCMVAAVSYLLFPYIWRS